MIKSIKTFALLAVVTVSVLSTSCRKKDSFDDTAPSTNVDPNLTINITIDSLKTLLTGSAPQYIYDDLICAGIVVADDRSGNFYKEMVIQDATGGISIMLDQNYFYTNYFIGRRVFVKLKGLFIGNVDGTIKLGGLVNSSIDRIPAAVIADHLIGGKWNLKVEPKNLKISEITLADINMLIEIDSAQFESASIGKPFADVINKETVNHNVEECNGGILIVRSSGYANFASNTIPCRAGKVRGVFQIYDYGSGYDAQLFLRDINDVVMNDDRCGTISTPLDSIDEDFINVPTNVTLKDTGWIVITPTGDNSWQGDLYQGNFAAEATAYSASGAVETWLVAPPFNLANADTLSFRTQTAFQVTGQVGLSVWFSTNFDQCNPDATIWQQLNANLADDASGNNWILSGDVALSSFTGTGYVAFKYVGNGSTGQTMNYRVDDVKIR